MKKKILFGLASTILSTWLLCLFVSFYHTTQPPVYGVVDWWQVTWLMTSMPAALAFAYLYNNVSTNSQPNVSREVVKEKRDFPSPPTVSTVREAGLRIYSQSSRKKSVHHG